MDKPYNLRRQSSRQTIQENEPRRPSRGVRKSSSNDSDSSSGIALAKNISAIQIQEYSKLEIKLTKIREFQRNYLCRKSDIEEISERYAKVTHTETGIERANRENAKRRIEIARLQKIVDEKRLKVKDLHGRIQQQAMFQNIELAAVKKVKDKQGYILKYHQKYSEYISTRKTESTKLLSDLKQARLKQVEASSTILFPIGVMLSHQVSAGSVAPASDSHRGLRDSSDSITTSPLLGRSVVQELIPGVQESRGDLISDAVDTQYDGQRWRTRRQNPPAIRSRARSKGKYSKSPSRPEYVTDVSDTSFTPHSVSTSKQSSADPEPNPTSVQQRYITTPETCFSSIGLDIHKCSEEETTCRSEIDHIIAPDWQRPEASSFDGPAAGSKATFYRIESGIWHCAQFLNLLQDIFLRRDVNFSLELGSLGRLRRAAKNERDGKYTVEDVQQKLDDSLSSETLNLLFQRLTSRISSWILSSSHSLTDIGEAVLRTHHDLLANMDLLVSVLLGKYTNGPIKPNKFGATLGLNNQGTLSSSGSFLMSFAFKSPASDQSSSTSSTMSGPLYIQEHNSTGSDQAKIPQNPPRRLGQIPQITLPSQIRSFISCNRKLLVLVIGASDDEELKRALPWTSLTTLAQPKVDGFEAVSIDEFVGCLEASDRTFRSTTGAESTTTESITAPIYSGLRLLSRVTSINFK